MIKKTLFLMAIWLLTLHPAPAGQEEWVPRAEVKAPLGNLSLPSRWDPRTGIRLRISSQDDGRSVELAITDRDCKLSLDPEKAFPPAFIQGQQFNLDALPAGSLPQAEVIVKFRTESWTVYIENRPIVVLPAPFLPPAMVAQPATQIPAGEPKTRFQKTEGVNRFTDRFLVEREEGAESQPNTNEVESIESLLPDWQVQSGTWALHTAIDSSIERENIKADAKKKPEPDRSPNFYSLKGSGTNAVISSGQYIFDAYHVETAVETAPGEAGVVFYLQPDGSYHAFTIHMPEDAREAVLCLWKHSAAAPAFSREILAAVKTPLTLRQWVKLKVKTYPNRIQCFLDNTKVIDLSSELPVGGKFGMVVNSPMPVHFDDVMAESNHDLDFRSLNDIRRYVLAEEGRFFAKTGFSRLFSNREDDEVLTPGKSKREQHLMLGSVAHAGHVFSADFHTGQNPGTVGIIGGFTHEDEPYLRFTRSLYDEREFFRLERVARDHVEVLEEFSPEGKAPETGEKVNLMADAGTPGEWRLYRDNRLVLIHHPESPVAGASGLHVGPNTTVKISNLLYRFGRPELYRNMYEKNRYFVEDPFMRHWSSPEGEWLEQKDKSVWHKSDFFGRFRIRLPLITNSVVHLGIDENSSNGVIVISMQNDEMTLTDTRTSPDPGARVPAASFVSASLSEVTGHKRNDEQDAVKTGQWYTVHCEDQWLWITTGDIMQGDELISGPTLLKWRMEEPLQGRRTRIAGFSTEQLKHSFVERYNTKDYLFTESLHEWTINGGRWEVVNRFQCQPRWSHMNGESKTTLAALWTKYIFKGDFCLEMYAGMRHGWYQRAGDLNITIMNHDTTPSQGYTVTCTGWDQDHSQQYSRFLKNGAEIARSEKYLVPRVREGSKRQGYTPLIQAGRDLHGAWYYIKLRRIGDRLEYYFDNELVFSYNDSQPIPEGSMGIWTFMNSMMVARVKISAEEIRPRQVPFQPVPGPDLQAVAAETKIGHRDIQKDGQLLELMLPENWATQDPVGRSFITWHKSPAGAPYMVVQNTLGSGNMLAQSEIPPVPYNDLAGWRFLVKRTPKAEFNLHYSIGHLKEDGSLQVSRSFFHRISGSDFADGPIKSGGELSVAPSPATGEDWHQQGEWIPVEVWLPTEGLKYLVREPKLVRLDGFGNLHASDVLQGLTGNGPGEAYAIKGLSEIRYGTPQLTTPKANTKAPDAFTFLEQGSQRALPLSRTTSLEELSLILKGMDKPGLIRTAIQIHRPTGDSIHELSWINLAPTPDITCRWSPEIPNAVELSWPGEYPDRRLAFADVLTTTLNLESFRNDLNRRILLLPRKEPLTTAFTDSIPITVAVDEKTRYSFSLKHADNPLPEPPSLIRMTGISPLIKTFEDRDMTEPLALDPARMQVRHLDPEQGSFLEVFNNGHAQRLAALFAGPFDLAGYPLFFFRYRGEPMSRVSLSLDSHLARLSEDYSRAKDVRYGTPLALDGKWHSWLGFTTDIVVDQPISNQMFRAEDLQIRSSHSVDQTGLFTRWNLDDVVLGPAVRTGEQLTFTPFYFAVSGIRQVAMALGEGSTESGQIEEEKMAALSWQDIPNAKETVPDVSKLQDGPCFLFLKATDQQGQSSRITSIPFLLDRQEPTVTHSFVKTKDPLHNETDLHLTFDLMNGAPVNPASMQIRWNGMEIPAEPMGSALQHTPARSVLTLNWPYIFRRQLDQSRDGATNQISLSGIRDGAGNSSPEVTIPVTIDYAKDHAPPTLLPTLYPSNVLWQSGWESSARTAVHFTALRSTSVKLIPSKQEGAYLKIQLTKENSSIDLPLKDIAWIPEKHPLLAFRIRRPVIPEDDATRIDLVIEFAKNDTYLVSLTHPDIKSKKRQRHMDPPIVWQSNIWHDVILDIRELVNDSPEEAIDKLFDPNEPVEKNLTADEEKKIRAERKISSLRFRITDPIAKSAIHLQGLYIFAPWHPGDKISMDAFDASGIRSVAWRREGQQSGASLSPGELTASGPVSGWLSAQVRDRAGNLSAPFSLPLGPEDYGISPIPAGNPVKPLKTSSLTKETIPPDENAPIPAVPTADTSATNTNAVAITYQFDESAGPDPNDRFLRVIFHTEAEAPLRMEDLSLSWNGAPVATGPQACRMETPEGRSELVLNWPLLLCHELAGLDSGQHGQLTISSIRTNGLPVPDYTIAMGPGVGHDTTPPSLVAAQYPSNIFWTTAWEWKTSTALEASEGSALTLIHRPDQEPHLSVSIKDSGSITRHIEDVPWNADTFPFLAFRIRRDETMKNRASAPLLTLELDDGRTATFALTDTSPAQGIKIPLSSPWSTGKWHTVMLDVQAELEQAFPGEQSMIRSFSFRNPEPDKLISFDLQSLFIFSAWRPEDKVLLTAYDVGGMKGISWSMELEETPPAIHPFPAFTSTEEARGWLIMRPEDKSGNPGSSIRVPLFRPGSGAMPHDREKTE